MAIIISCFKITLLQHFTRHGSVLFAILPDRVKQMPFFVSHSISPAIPLLHPIIQMLCFQNQRITKQKKNQRSITL